MYITSKEMLLCAQAGGYAIGAFNIENLEMAQGVLLAAQTLHAPVMLQTTSSTLKYASPAAFAGMVRALAEEVGVPVALHLDHGSSFELAQSCVKAGYTSVMIDGSALPFDANLALCAQTVAMCAPAEIPVEGELGQVGGKEDSTEAVTGYTNPEEAARFAQDSGVSSLAVAIGTAHGVYKVKPVLDVGRLRAIRKLVEVPLVLHGASGLSEQDIRECVAAGICKVNFATELRQAYTTAVRAVLGNQPEAYDPKVYGKLAREATCKAAMERMVMCGCAGKA